MSVSSTGETDRNFNIYVMSIDRWNAIMTKRLFEYCTYVVREEQAEKYREAGIDDMLVIPEGTVHDFMSTFYWIIANTPEKVVCIVDDDVKFMCYRNDKRYPITRQGNRHHGMRTHWTDSVRPESGACF